MIKLLDLLKEYQLNVMLVLSVICGLLSFFVLITRALPPKRKRILMSLELSGMVLLISDRFAYFTAAIRAKSATGWSRCAISLSIS